MDTRMTLPLERDPGRQKGEAMQSQNLFRVDVYNSFKHEFLLNAARSQTFADVMLLKFDTLSRVTCLVWR